MRSFAISKKAPAFCTRSALFSRERSAPDASNL
jgi:hypothetical protein